MVQDRDNPEPLWTAEQVASYLGLHIQTVYQKAASGDMPSLKIGRGLRFRPSAIERWLEAQQPVTEPAA